ncbi:DUF2244 domain-containing protein [Rhodobacteraceae bacterium 2CG4]|uniref:DUF2244 domain-containing protein n=1 Tax=Halovulum marinum TaxID=2662447 RepID=A0A6L5YZY7_9RHOB|nr:DUF2244 domain-containing protein [Halovulum marinum]MSU89827.1 DUF2244 domain-containing protein [Halovulum marinum]
MRPQNGNNDEAGAETPASSLPGPSRSDPPLLELELHPHRSMSLRGFRWVLIITSVGLAVPLVPFRGTPVGWGLLPFLVGALVALYLAIRRNYRDARLHEVLRLWPDLITVERHETDGRVLRWQANPYWVTVTLHDDARLENYLTLKGAGREIELGAFLGPEERIALHARLRRALAQIAAGG